MPKTTKTAPSRSKRITKSTPIPADVLSSRTPDLSSSARSTKRVKLSKKSTDQTAADRSHVQLVVRARELDAMKQALLYVQSLPPAEKEAWMRSNGEHMSLAFEQFVNVSTDTLRHAVFDDEAMQLSYELVQELKVTEQLVQQVFGDPTILSS